MDCLTEILDCMPEQIKNAVMLLNQSERTGKLSEIRLRAENLQTLVVAEKELVISTSGKAEADSDRPLRLSAQELSEVVFKLCGGSVYAHFDEIKNGFISKNGIRIGVCGTGVIKNGIPSGFSSYSALNIRIPRYIPDCADLLFEHIKKRGSEYVGGILVISPPGGGKTTFLRSVASGLSQGYSDRGVISRKRVCIIDERGEIFSKDAFNRGLSDFVTFLPKAYSIELATRALSPEYIVCDEIGNETDAIAISEGATKGVTFIASCHGKSLWDVLEKKPVRRLFEDKVFSTACELTCINGRFRCEIRRFSLKGDV